MEWVIAALAVGCLFFAFQVIMDYVKYKAVISPRIQQLEEAKKELQERISAARGELDERRGQLDPLKGEIEQLEQEFIGLQQQLDEERSKQRNQPPAARIKKGGTGSR